MADENFRPAPPGWVAILIDTLHASEDTIGTKQRPAGETVLAEVVGWEWSEQPNRPVTDSAGRVVRWGPRNDPEWHPVVAYMGRLRPVYRLPHMVLMGVFGPQEWAAGAEDRMAGKWLS